MKAYLVGLHREFVEFCVCRFEDPIDPSNPTPREFCNIHLNAQATVVLLSALSPKYNKVIGLDIAEEMLDTLHIAHEGVRKVRQSKIDLLIAQLIVL